VRVELETIGIAAVAHNHYITSRAGQRIPDIVTFLSVLRHAKRPNLRLPAQE